MASASANTNGSYLSKNPAKNMYLMRLCVTLLILETAVIGVSEQGWKKL